MALCGAFQPDPFCHAVSHGAQPSCEPRPRPAPRRHPHRRRTATSGRLPPLPAGAVPPLPASRPEAPASPGEGRGAAAGVGRLLPGQWVLSARLVLLRRRPRLGPRGSSLPSGEPSGAGERPGPG